ncbi:MAG: transposase [Endomicrobium sp.]|nr:transposase [Endomicrobium sp.]
MQTEFFKKPLKNIVEVDETYDRKFVNHKQKQYVNEGVFSHFKRNIKGIYH